MSVTPRAEFNLFQILRSLSSRKSVVVVLRTNNSNPVETLNLEKSTWKKQILESIRSAGIPKAYSVFCYAVENANNQGVRLRKVYDFSEIDPSKRLIVYATSDIQPYCNDSYLFEEEFYPTPSSVQYSEKILIEREKTKQIQIQIEAKVLTKRLKQEQKIARMKEKTARLKEKEETKRLRIEKGFPDHRKCSMM